MDILEAWKHANRANWEAFARAMDIMEAGFHKKPIKNYKPTECICSSRELFDYGCRCGFYMRSD